MSSDLVLQRLADLEENIRRDLELLKDYEDKLRYEDDPRRMARYGRDIERQHRSLDDNWKEYRELEPQLTPAEKQHVIGLLDQKEAKLAQVPVWNIPHLRNLNFTGRDQVLADLRLVLTSDELGGWRQTLSGLGGVGKTQIAVEYAYRHKDEYRVIWWVRSEEAALLSSDYAGLASSLGLPEKDLADQSMIVEAVRKWLENNTDWLLVFDNAQAPQVIKGYMPRTGGHVIITSRNPNWDNVANVLPLKIFDRAESVEFLAKRTDMDETTAAKDLAEELGDLPLALEQAGAYIKETPGISISDYVDYFRKRHRELWGDEKRPLEYKDKVDTTWSLAMKKMPSESAELLNLCSFLAPDDIPFSLLISGREHLPETLAAVVEDKIKLGRAAKHLRTYSLIDADSDSLSIHRLVQLVTRDRLGQDDQKKWSETAVGLVNDTFPDDSYEVQTWPECAVLLPHALAAAGHAEELGQAPEASGRLLNQVGLYLKGRAEFVEARKCFERALKIGETAYGPDHPAVAIDVNNLGSVLLDQGDLDGARKCYERALRIDEKVYGTEHRKVAIVVNNLGTVLRDLGDLEEARKCYERALKIDEAAYGPNHTEVARCVNNLGMVLGDLGDPDGAKKCIERALKIDEDTYGPDHPQVGIYVNNLGCVLRYLDDLEGARKCFERALKIDEAAYGPAHPAVVTMVNNLGMVLGDLGDLDGARKCFERALKIDEDTYGPDHPKVAIRVNNLGNVLRVQGDLDGAKKCFERALKIGEAIHGLDHPQVGIYVNNLGMVLQDQGDLDGDKKYLERALNIFETSLGKDHPKTKIVRDNLERLIVRDILERLIH